MNKQKWALNHENMDLFNMIEWYIITVLMRYSGIYNNPEIDRRGGKLENMTKNNL